MGIIWPGTWQHGQDMHVSLQMLAATAALLPNVESGMDQKCSDRFYDTCILPNPEIATHEISLEACQLACELEQTVGFCDWFIFSPHDYQSCRMFTKRFHGDLENVLDGRCFKKGGPTCETDVDGVVVECPDKCESCHRQKTNATLSMISAVSWTNHLHLCLKLELRILRVAKAFAWEDTPTLCGILMRQYNVSVMPVETVTATNMQ